MAVFNFLSPAQGHKIEKRHSIFIPFCFLKHQNLFIKAVLDIPVGQISR